MIFTLQEILNSTFLDPKRHVISNSFAFIASVSVHTDFLRQADKTHPHILLHLFYMLSFILFSLTPISEA